LPLTTDADEHDTLYCFTGTSIVLRGPQTVTRVPEPAWEDTECRGPSDDSQPSQWNEWNDVHLNPYPLHSCLKPAGLMGC
jgi:hypothetical protein